MSNAAAFKPRVLVTHSMFELMQGHMRKSQAHTQAASTSAALMSGQGPDDLPHLPATDVQLDTSAPSTSVPVNSMLTTGANVFGQTKDVPKMAVEASPPGAKKHKTSDSIRQHPRQPWYYSHPKPSDSESSD